MPRRWPPQIAALAEVLDAVAGTYLDGTVRQGGVTCAICSAPVQGGFRICFPCNRIARAAASVADRVATLVYAVEPDSQTYRVVRNYKAQRPGPDLRFVVSALLAIGLRAHTGCLGRLGGVPIDGWTVVPSTRGRTVLRDLVAAVSTKPELEIEVRFAGQQRGREFAPEQWHVPSEINRDHVLVIDDSWVTGAHAQSVAGALKSAGAKQVSMLAVARVLRADWEANKDLVARLKGGTFNWKRCPWTGGDCPEG
jgi:hypothetical protein